MLSNFRAETMNGEGTYDELGTPDLVAMTGYKPAFFDNVGKCSVALALLNGPRMKRMIDDLPSGKFGLKEQRALRKSARQSLSDNHDTYKKLPIFSILNDHIFRGSFSEIRRLHDI